MKKLGTWINNKLDHQKHPTRLSIVLIAIESIGAITAGIALAFGDAKAYPVPAILKEYLADTTSEQNAVAAGQNPTVPEEPLQ